MIRRIILETIGFLLLAMMLALLYHALAPSGITIIKGQPPASPSSQRLPGPGGDRYGN